MQQILALETSLFLSGLNLYDQHRDMRLDIDNMSYEVGFFFKMYLVLRLFLFLLSGLSSVVRV